MKKLIALICVIGSIHVSVERVSCAEVAFPLAQAGCAYAFAKKYASEPGKAHGYLAAYYAVNLLFDGVLLSAGTSRPLCASEGCLSLALVARHGWLAYKGWDEHIHVDADVGKEQVTKTVIKCIATVQIWVELALWLGLKGYKKSGFNSYEEESDHRYPHGRLKALLCCRTLLDCCFLMIEKDPSKAVVASTIALHVFSLATAMSGAVHDELRSENRDLAKRYWQKDRELDEATTRARDAEAEVRAANNRVCNAEERRRRVKIKIETLQNELRSERVKCSCLLDDKAKLKVEYDQVFAELKKLQASGGGSGMQAMKKALQALPPAEMQKLFKSCTLVLHADKLANLGLSTEDENLLSDFYKCLSSVKSTNDNKPFNFETK